MNIFDQMVSRYKVNTSDDLRNAKHEVMQQIALAGLYRGGFFNKAAFYGGTCLRLFHDLNRFSEDMDFSLLETDENFKLENYFEPVVNEFKAHGREVVITKKAKKNQTNIESAFLKEDTAIYNIQFSSERTIRIKIEVDTKPPAGFQTEFKLLLMPFSFMTRCYTLPDLFAGKMHEMLFRNWKNRVKGRDWSDFEWYVRNNVELNFNHLYQRTIQLDQDVLKAFDRVIFKQLLKDKIAKTNIGMVRADIAPFIKNHEEIEIWSADYFLQLVDLINFQTK
jgi:predicted nucleotidyltransferase component of viral defense system